MSSHVTPSDALPNCDMLRYTDQVTGGSWFFIYALHMITIHPIRLAALFGVASFIVAIMSLLINPFALLGDFYVAATVHLPVLLLCSVMIYGQTKHARFGRSATIYGCLACVGLGLLHVLMIIFVFQGL
jgi:hypothetical protein